MPEPLEYHRPVLQLLGIEAASSPGRLAVIEERERLWGVRFPESIRAWFAIPDAEAVFCRQSGHNLRPLDELGDPREATTQGYLLIGWENQGVYTWYVRLDEGDDPAVFHDDDRSCLDDYSDLSTWDWEPFANSFTNFIFDIVIASSHFNGWSTGLRWTATDAAPDEATLRELKSWLREGPTTETDEAKVHRFFTADGLVVVRSIAPEHRANGTAEWHVEADTPEALLDFGRRLWHVGTLSRTLKAQSCTKQSRAKGNELLRRLRGEGIGS